MGYTWISGMARGTGLNWIFRKVVCAKVQVRYVRARMIESALPDLVVLGRINEENLHE